MFDFKNYFGDKLKSPLTAQTIAEDVVEGVGRLGENFKIRIRIYKTFYRKYIVKQRR